MSETPFTEANALLAITSGDIDTAREILADSYPHELRSLGDAAYKLGDICRQMEHGLIRRQNS